MTWTGFSGADIFTPRGEPIPILLMKPENPDFFLITPGLASLASSDNRFGDINWFSLTRGGCFSDILSPAEKLADGLKGGLINRGSGEVCDNGGGGGRRKEFWYPDAFVESKWFKMDDPSKGAPTNSWDVFSLSGRVELELELEVVAAFAPPAIGVGTPNSEPARAGEGPEICRSRDEFEDANTAALGEVVLRVCPYCCCGWDLG